MFLAGIGWHSSAFNGQAPFGWRPGQLELCSAFRVPVPIGKSLINLGAQLQPNNWYLLRVVADYSTRYFKSFTVVGPGINKTIDLSPYFLAYPNYLPIDNRAMTFYAGNARSANTANGSGAPLVYIDDVSGGTFWPNGTDHPLFSNGFESQSVVGPQPISGPPIPVGNYVQGKWYLERSASLFTIQQKPFARSGSYVGVANASLN
jgi:hypothetical protein